MGHHHHHHHFQKGTETKLWFSIGLNAIITLAEIVGGILSNSLALLSDAVHNLNDTFSLGISLIAGRISRKKATPSNTFGYRRAQIIAAFINLITLVIVAIFLIKEGIERFFYPEPIDGLTMFWVATIGLAGNVITALLLLKDSESNLNIRSAFLHIVSDAVSSVGVIMGGWLVYTYQWYIVDTILTISIALYILWHSWIMLKETITILMEATPPGIDLTEVSKAICELKSVEEIHHLHVWRLDDHKILLECHVVIRETELHQLEAIKTSIKNSLEQQFGINHSTLEFEISPCEEELHAD